MQWHRRLIAGLSSWRQISSNAVSCGIQVRDIRNKRGMSASPPVLLTVRTTPQHLPTVRTTPHHLPTVRTTPPQLSMSSPNLKIIKIYFVRPRTASFCFCLCFCPIFVLFCCMFSNIKSSKTLQCARVKCMLNFQIS